MKTKRFLALLLVMLMAFAMVGTMVGCGAKDGDDKVTEVQNDKTENKDSEETPDPTATPEPTPTPEVLPTAEELVEANKGKGIFKDKYKMTMKFAYKGTDGVDNLEMSIYAENMCYEDVEYEKGEVYFNMSGISDTSVEETYYVDDKASGMRTEYSYDAEYDMWFKSEYAYIDLEEEDEEDSDETPLDTMTNITITKEGDVYVLSGDLSSDETTDLTESMGVDGAEITSAKCRYEFDAKTKAVVSANVVITFADMDVDGVTMTMDDLVVSMESITAPIEIPEEALAAETDVEVDIDWDYIYGDDEDENIPEPEKYDVSELPANWDDWYKEEYDSKSGSFLMWSDTNAVNIPVTLYANDNWYFDTQYKYTLYLAVNDPAIEESSPAHEVDYSDSGVVVKDPERGAMELLEKDYENTKTLDDVVPLVCNGKQCFYLDISYSDYSRSFVVFQDIGMEYYVEINIRTYDLTTEPLAIVEKFLINLTQSGGQAI